MKRNIVFILAYLFVAAGLAVAGEVSVGLLSFDQFIPASGTATGINAFDIFNFTGPSFGPTVGPPYASDSLTFDNATLTVNFSGGSSQTFNLGDLSPGELLDTSGNPIVQFPTTDNFVSAEFTASLTRTPFSLSDGTTFTAAGSLTVNLTPSSGSTLVAGTDFAVINAETHVTPEPSTLFETFAGLLAVSALYLWKRKRRSFQFQ